MDGGGDCMLDRGVAARATVGGRGSSQPWQRAAQAAEVEGEAQARVTAGLSRTARRWQRRSRGRAGERHGGGDRAHPLSALSRNLCFRSPSPISISVSLVYCFLLLMFGRSLVVENPRNHGRGSGRRSHGAMDRRGSRSAAAAMAAEATRGGREGHPRRRGERGGPPLVLNSLSVSIYLWSCVCVCAWVAESWGLQQGSQGLKGYLGLQQSRDQRFSFSFFAHAGAQLHDCLPSDCWSSVRVKLVAADQKEATMDWVET